MAQITKTGRFNMNNRGFTIIELLIVIIIIGVLVGVAVPYYNDYIYDSRLAVLKQNLATMRNTINQFRGDRGRGPFRVTVQRGNVDDCLLSSSDPTKGSELVAGPYLPTTSVRQTNVQYLRTLPYLMDPGDGSDMVSKIKPTNDYLLAFYDIDGDGKFDIDTEFAFWDTENKRTDPTATPPQYDADETTYIDGSGANPADGDPALALDYIDFNVTSSDGIKY